MNNTFRIIIASLAILLAFLVFHKNTPATTFFADDAATDFIVARLFSAGDRVLVGPPSHVGGRHPGPIYYWYVFVVAAISNFDVYFSSIIFALTKLCAAVLICVISSLLVPKDKRPLAIVATICCCCSLGYVDIFRTQWQSHYLIIPSSVAFVSSLLFIHYGKRYLPLALFGLSLLFQSHLSSVPVVAGIVCVLSIYIFLNRKSLSGVWFNTLAEKMILGYLPLCLIIFMWIPVLYNELFYKSNFLNLLNVHGAPKEKVAGLRASIALLIRFISQNTLSVDFVHANLLSMARVASILLVALLASRLWRAESKIRWSAMVLVVPCLLQVVALSRFNPHLYAHYLNSAIALPPVFLSIAVCQGASWVQEYFRGRRSMVGFAVAFFGAAFISYFSIQSVRGAIISYERASTYRREPYHNVASISAIATVIRADCKERCAEAKLYLTQHAHILRNGFYYYLDSIRYDDMEYHEFFGELQSFRDAKVPMEEKLGYVITCPKPYSDVKRSLYASFGSDWSKIREVNLSNCKECGSCGVLKLEK